MKEYKIECKNPMEKSEAINLLVKIGYVDASTKDEYLTLVTFDDGDVYSITTEDFQYEDNKILSIDQLKDLVVLKRNDVADATHGNDAGQRGYLTDDNVEFFWNYHRKHWNLLTISTFKNRNLKPVSNEETVTKEYLDKDCVLREVKQTGGDNHVPSDWIEVPEGAVKLLKNNENNKHFVSKDGQFMADYDIKAGFGYWYDSAVSLEYYFSCMGGTIVWARHAQPEELPFVDDAQELDKIKILVGGSLESAINRAKSLGYWNCQFEKIPNDAYWLLCNENGTVDFSKVENIEGEYEEFTMASDDDPVSNTLNQRQSQYGDFSEVASTTQYLLQMLSNDEMSDVQLEALHMICSKLSRIAHGGPNHVDSWHDIAGYATLVVNDIT